MKSLSAVRYGGCVMGTPRIVSLLMVLLTTTSAVVSKQPPNIVFIVADDLGWNDVSFHGSKQIPTPNIDALAYDGIILNNYYVQPICTPTRSALLTGRYPIHTGMQHRVIVGAQPYGLGLGEKLLPQYLRELGYANHIVGKWHLGFYKTEYTPTQRGFDSHYGYYQGDQDYYNHNYWARYPDKEMNGFDFRKNLTLDKSVIGKYSTELFTTEAERLIRNHNKAQPLFLYMAQQAVHSGNPDNPLQAPQRYLDKFAHIKNDKRRKFAAMVSALDDSVGNVTRALTHTGLINNTVIMFTTDNGGPVNGFDFNAASNWPLRGCKATLWEGGTRAAGFLWSPLLEKSGYTSPHLMHVTDWFPTTLHLAGYSMDKVQRDRVDGLDMWHTLSTNQESSPRTDILYNIDGGTAALRVQNLKLLQGDQGRGYSGWYPPWQLPTGANHTMGPWSSHRQANHTALSKSAKSGPNNNLLKETHTQEEEAPADMFSSGLTPLLQKALGRVLQRPRSAPVVVDCGPRPGNASTNCDPVTAPCLYDLTKDPCEFNNLAAAMPTAVKELLVRLETYRATAVPARNKREDPKGYPVYHSGNWVPWVNATL